MAKKINILFWFVWAMTFSLTLMESVFYPGFIIKHLNLNPIIMVVITGILALVVLVLKYIYKSNQKINRTPLFFFIFVFTCFVVFKIADRLVYPNFVFSKLHVQPDSLRWPVIVSFFPVLLSGLYPMNLKKIFNFQFILIIFSFLVIAFNIFKIYKTELWVVKFIIAHPNASYDDKMRRSVGPVFYNFTQFINNNTPESSILAIPPQAFPWPQSGNGAYMRYFVYPRDIGNGDEYSMKENDNVNNYDYILLAWGETSTTQGKFTHGWPKFDVAAEKIIFMNKDGTYGGEVKGNYIYKDYEGREIWGIIKIKH